MVKSIIFGGSDDEGEDSSCDGKHFAHCPDPVAKFPVCYFFALLYSIYCSQWSHSF